MINDTDVKLIIDVFKKCDLTEDEEKYLNKLELIQEKSNIHKDVMDKLKDIEEKLQERSK